MCVHACVRGWVGTCACVEIPQMGREGSRHGTLLFMGQDTSKGVDRKDIHTKRQSDSGFTSLHHGKNMPCTSIYNARKG